MGGGSIRLVDLCKSFGEVVAVDRVNLAIEGGEFFSLLGPSGCGKTTTLRLVAGFERPTAGRIEIDGVDMAQTPPHLRPVNTVFQNYALFPHLSVADNVAFGLRYQNASRQETARKVGAALELVQLSGLDRRRPSELSGGQQQRVALARALVLEPRVLLLDEPSLGLAPQIMQTIFHVLREINAQGTTLLLVEQNARMALQVAHEAYVLETGQIAMHGPARELAESDEVRKAYLGVAH
jgi:spermidine/putrescine transport system ATP-binding protein